MFLDGRAGTRRAPRGHWNRASVFRKGHRRSDSRHAILRQDVTCRVVDRGTRHALPGGMPNSDNGDRHAHSGSCAWCGADRDVRSNGDGTQAEPTDTICPRCEADFESLSKAPEAARIERKRQSSSSEDLAASSWMIRRRRGWITAWLVTTLAGLLSAA